MSCRHDLALGTCKRCYPNEGTRDPGPEEDYEPNLEGPGAITKEEFELDNKNPAPLSTVVTVPLIKPLVLIESPYARGDRERNLRYLSWCEADSFQRGEHPIASHGNCTGYIPETAEGRREGFAWRERIRLVCNLVAYYVDLGVSQGMEQTEIRDINLLTPREHRRLSLVAMCDFERGMIPPGSMRRIPVDRYLFPLDKPPLLAEDGS